MARTLTIIVSCLQDCCQARDQCLVPHARRHAQANNLTCQLHRRTIAVHDEAPLQGRSWVKTMFLGRQLMVTRMQTRGNHSRGCRAGIGTVGHMSQGGLCTRSFLGFCPQPFLPVRGVSTSVHFYLEGSSLSNKTTILKALRTMCCGRCVLHSTVQNRC